MGGSDCEVHTICWAIAEHVQGEFRTTKFNAAACGEDGRALINHDTIRSLFVLEPRTDECINVLTAKRFAMFSKLGELV
jgi:hypothetical protein